MLLASSQHGPQHEPGKTTDFSNATSDPLKQFGMTSVYHCQEKGGIAGGSSERAWTSQSAPGLTTRTSCRNTESSPQRDTHLLADFINLHAEFFHGVWEVLHVFGYFLLVGLEIPAVGPLVFVLEIATTARKDIRAIE